MPLTRIAPKALDEVQRALGEYLEEIARCESRGDLKENTAQTYSLHATNFVRWLAGDFTPGERRRAL